MSDDPTDHSPADRLSRIEKCLEIALTNRNFEIDLLWKRTIVFWGFVGVLFIGVAQTLDKSRGLAIVLAGLGVVFSVVWTLVNRGSKSWQESWEIKSAQFFQERFDYTNLFRRATASQDDIIWFLRARPYSLSRLLIALSDFTVIFWLGLVLYLLPLERACPAASWLRMNAIPLFAGFSGLYILYILIFCRSRAGDASGALH